MKLQSTFIGILLLVSWVDIRFVQAQRNTMLTGFQQTTSADGYQELKTPFTPQDTSVKGNIMIHVLDKDLKSYSGYEFRLEEKDFATKQWKLYKSYQVCVNDNAEQEYIMIVIPELPNGYYRAWAQCTHTGTIGSIPILLNRTQTDNPEEVVQYTLEIPQSQYWVQDLANQVTVRERKK